MARFSRIIPFLAATVLTFFILSSNALFFPVSTGCGTTNPTSRR
jgi:hypothetical protein